jgi:hypothetical protein
VFGAVVAPMEREYGDQEGHVGSAFGGPRSAGGVFERWLFDELKKALAERVLNAELDDHLEAATGCRVFDSHLMVRSQTCTCTVAIPLRPVYLDSSRPECANSGHNVSMDGRVALWVKVSAVEKGRPKAALV